MINEKHAPGSVDCISEMYELSKKKKVKTYIALFIAPPEVSMVIRGLSVIGLELNGFIYDESITAAKPNPEYAKKGFKDRFDYLDLKELKQVKDNEPDTEIVIISNHIPVKEDIVINAAEEAGIDFQLSGHTHRGQVWPISWITDRIYECSHGELRRGNTHYYVSSGIGIWGGKFRIGTQSEYIVTQLTTK